MSAIRQQLQNPIGVTLRQHLSAMLNPENGFMTIVLSIAFVAMLAWLMIHVRRKSSEYAASGLLRSPLYWSASSLTMVLLGLAMYMAHRSEPIPLLLWGAVAALVPTILVLRRALKRRYPV